MILSCVTDEISMDVEEAISTGVNRGIYHYELRSIGEYRYPFYPKRIYNALLQLKREYGLTYTAVSPGIFKNSEKESHLPNQEMLWNQIFEYACLLDIPRIIIFAKNKCTGISEYYWMVDEIKDFTQRAGERGLVVSIENSASTCCCSAEETRRLVEDVGLYNFSVNWDPGNSAMGGCLDLESDYKLLKDFVDNVHIKDLNLDEDGRRYYVPIGQGVIDYKRVVERLTADGYQGCLTIETHCKPSRQAFEISIDYFSKLIRNTKQNTT